MITSCYHRTLRLFRWSVLVVRPGAVGDAFRAVAFRRPSLSL